MKSVFTNLLAGLALLTIAAAPALADSLFPAAGELWPNDYLHFFSTDMRPVQVTLRRSMFTNDGEQATITLPRAWITFASGYDPLKLDRLPDAIETGSVTIALADPDFKALSVRSREIAQEQHIGLGDAVKRLRTEQYQVDVNYVRRGIRTEDIQFNSAHGPDGIVERDGLRYDPKWMRYLGQIGSDLFFFAECQFSSRADTFCHYRARPGEDIALRVDFLDFRFHGGPGYANERLSRLIAALCKQIEPHCFAVDRHASADDQR